MPETFEQFRRRVPALKNQAYLETASTGLVPDFVHDAVQAYQEDRFLRGGDSLWQHPGGRLMDTSEMMDWSKAAIGQMIGAEKENIVFGQNSSHVYSLLTAGMEFSPGDNVILPENGWMANRFAWQIREAEGLQIRYVPRRGSMILPEDIEKLCDERTRAVCLPLVEPSTGFLADAAGIGSFCRKNHIWFAADGVQALGVLPVDVEKMQIDFLVGNDYKWMMNYCGTGYGYIHPALRQTLKQRAAGWLSDDTRFDTTKQRLCLRDDAGRFELGFPTVSGIFGVGLVAEKYCEMGSDSVRDYVLGLQDYLKERLSEVRGVRLLYDFPRKNRSAIAVLLVEAENTLTNEALTAAGVTAHLKPYDKEGRRFMRVSFHYYNNREDVDRLVEALGGERRTK